MKICTKCRTNTDDFSFDKRHKDGLQSHCRSCTRYHHKIHRKNNLEQCREKEKIRAREYLKTPQRKKYMQEWYLNNKTHLQAYNQKKERKLKRQELSKKYRKKDPSSYRYRDAKKLADRLKRTPKWLTSYHTDQIKEFYMYASLLSETLDNKYQVDHIIPLQGKNISGLHVPWNLQILEEKENNFKRNRFDGTYENQGWKRLWQSAKSLLPNKTVFLEHHNQVNLNHP